MAMRFEAPHARRWLTDGAHGVWNRDGIRREKDEADIGTRGLKWEEKRRGFEVLHEIPWGIVSNKLALPRQWLLLPFCFLPYVASLPPPSVSLNTRTPHFHRITESVNLWKCQFLDAPTDRAE